MFSKIPIIATPTVDAAHGNREHSRENRGVRGERSGNMGCRGTERGEHGRAQWEQGKGEQRSA